MDECFEKGTIWTEPGRQKSDEKDGVLSSGRNMPTYAPSCYRLIFQSKIILKLCIIIDLSWFIDYEYRRVTVQVKWLSVNVARNKDDRDEY